MYKIRPRLVQVSRARTVSEGVQASLLFPGSYAKGGSSSSSLLHNRAPNGTSATSTNTVNCIILRRRCY